MMERTLIIGVVIICIAVLAGAIVVIRARNRRRSQSADYEVLLAELRRQADAQRELVVALTSAVELAIRHKDSGLNVITDSVGFSARNELEKESAKLKAQLAFIEEVMRKRDSEV
jgi:hypothetical protein